MPNAEKTRVKRYFHNDMVQVSRTCVVYDETGAGGILLDDITGTACTLIGISSVGLPFGGLSVNAKLIQVTNSIVNYLRIDPKNFTLVTTRVVDREQLCMETTKLEQPVISDALFQCCVNRKRDCDLPVAILVQLHLTKQVVTGFTGNQSVEKVDTQSRLMQLTIRLIDINDNPPRFSQPVHTVVISEGVQVGTKLILPSAEDLDSDEYGTLRYQLQPDEDNAFELVQASSISLQPYGYPSENSIPGQLMISDPSSNYYGPVSAAEAGLLSQIYLKVVKQLDWETKRQYSLSLLAKDQGSPSLTGQLEIKVLVTDENDNHPVFQNKTFTIHVPENYSSGKRLIHLSASDPDDGIAGRVEYNVVPSVPDSPTAFHGRQFPRQQSVSQNFIFPPNTSLQAPHRDLFHIDKHTGWLTTNGPLDYEKARHHMVRVIARDEAGHPGFDEATVHILVTDVNDVPPSISVATVLEGQQGYNASTSSSLNIYVTESPGWLAADSEKNRFSDFASNSEGMLLAFVAVSDPDTEQGGQFQCSLYPVRQTDSSNSPSFPASSVGYSGGLHESDQTANEGLSTAVAQASRFRLNPISTSQFELMHLGKFDREASAVEAVQIICADLGKPSLTASYTVRVHVADVNDMTPVFTRSHYQFSIKENIPGDTRIDKVTTVDGDSGRNGEVEYLLDQTGQEMFSVSPMDGTLYSKSPFDRELKQGYRFQVFARDRGSPNRLTGTTTVEVTILDVNDNAPEFIGLDSVDGCYNFRIAENEPPNSHVGLLIGTDKDADMNGQLKFRLVTSSPFFHVDETTGEITTLKQLDRERLAQYSLIVVAMDKGHPPRSTTAKLNIVVTDVNDHDPIVVFPANGRGNVSVSFREPPGEVVARIEARDPDEGSNGQLHYAIITGNRNTVFRLGSTSAELMIDRDLHAGDIGSYMLTIAIQDEGLPVRSTKVTLQVEVLDTPARLYTHRYANIASGDYTGPETYNSKLQHLARSGLRSDARSSADPSGNSEHTVIGTGAILAAIVALSCAIILVLLGITAYICGRRVMRISLLQGHRYTCGRNNTRSTLKPTRKVVEMNTTGKSPTSLPVHYNDPILLDPSNGTLLRCQFSSPPAASNNETMLMEDRQKLVCLTASQPLDGYFTCLPAGDQRPLAYEVIQNQPHLFVPSTGPHRCCNPKYYTMAAHNTDNEGLKNAVLSLTELHNTLPLEGDNRKVACPYRNSYTPRSLKWNMTVKHSHSQEDEERNDLSQLPSSRNNCIHHGALNICESPLSESSGIVQSQDNPNLTGISHKLRTVKSWETFSCTDATDSTAVPEIQPNNKLGDQLIFRHQGSKDGAGYVSEKPTSDGFGKRNGPVEKRNQPDPSRVSTFLPHFVPLPAVGTIFEDLTPAGETQILPRLLQTSTLEHELWKMPPSHRTRESNTNNNCVPHLLPSILTQANQSQPLAPGENKFAKQYPTYLMDVSLQSANLIDLLDSGTSLQADRSLERSSTCLNSVPSIVGEPSEFV